MSDFENIEAEVFGISVDSIFSNNEFSKINSIGFPLLSDVNRNATNSYGVGIDFVMPEYTAAQRSVFVINEDGKIGYCWIADNPGIEPNYQEIIDFCKR
jgi:peroxiredoxin